MNFIIPDQYFILTRAQIRLSSPLNVVFATLFLPMDWTLSLELPFRCLDGIRSGNMHCNMDFIKGSLRERDLIPSKHLNLGVWIVFRSSNMHCNMDSGWRLLSDLCTLSYLLVARK